MKMAALLCRCERANLIFMLERIAVALLLLTPAARAMAQGQNCLEVEPGKKLGPIAMGTPKKALASLNLRLADDFQDSVRVGPYAVALDYNDKVESAAVSLGEEHRCLKIGGKTHAADKPMELIALELGGCGPVELYESGSVVKCKSGVRFTAKLRGLEVRVTSPEDDIEPCTIYASPGIALYTTEGAKTAEAGGAEISVEPGKRYCMLGKGLTTELKPADVMGDLGFVSCTTEKGPTIRCPQGATFVFAGPKQALSKIEITKKTTIPGPKAPEAKAKGAKPTKASTGSR
jgi:hypothetical protein